LISNSSFAKIFVLFNIFTFQIQLIFTLCPYSLPNLRFPIEYNKIFLYISGKKQHLVLENTTSREENHFKHPGMQCDSSSTISSVPSGKLRLLEQEVLLPTGPQSSNSLPNLYSISELSGPVTSISASKSQVGRMSVISGKTPSLFSGLSLLIEAAEKEGIFDSSASSTSTSKSQKVRKYNLIFNNIFFLSTYPV
jgi:hypothetical protein